MSLSVIADAKNRNPSIAVDYILFIEWLVLDESEPEDEFLTGNHLHHFVNKIDIGGVRSVYVRCVHACDVIKALKDACSNVATQGVPLVQIDAHGCEQGLSPTQTAPHLPWSELWDSLRLLNVATNYSLIVIAASCYGAFSQYGVLDSIKYIESKGIDSTLPAPYAASLGFEGSVYVASLRLSLERFYEKFLLDGDLQAAVVAANEKLLSEANKRREKSSSNSERKEEFTLVPFGKVFQLALNDFLKGEGKELLVKLKKDYPHFNRDQLAKEAFKVNSLTRAIGVKMLLSLSGGRVWGGARFRHEHQ